LQVKSLSSVLKTLEVKKLGDRQLFDIFGQESGRAIKQLIGQSAELDRMTGEMTAGAAKGFAQKQNEIKSRGLEGQLARLKAVLEVLLIGEAGKDGLGLLGIATKAVEKLSGVVRFFSTLSPGTKKFIAVLGGVAAAVGPVLVGLGLVAGAIVKIAGAWALIAPWVSTIGAVLSGALMPLLVATGPIIAGVMLLAGAFGALHYAVVNSFGSWGNFFSDMWAGIGALWNAGIQGLKNMWTEFTMWLPNKVAELVDTVTGFFSKLWAGFLAHGAPMPGVAPEFGQSKLGAQLGPDFLTPDLKTPQQTPAQYGRVQVDFSNMPRGTRVAQAQNNTMPIDLGLGYSMVTP
jgi:hypothetical protein